MAAYDGRTVVHTVRPPFHPLLWSFAAFCFIGTLLTDIAYCKTAEMQWANFSAWLVSAGVLIGVVATVVAVVDMLVGRLAGEGAPIWLYTLGNLLALALSVVNAMVHTRDAWTSVVPWGLVLSALVVLILLVTGMLSRRAGYGRGVVVSDV